MAAGKPPCPDPRECCKYKKPYADKHHQYWPRTDYEAAGTIQARWRNLGKNTMLMCRCLHDEVHAVDAPPPMPDRDLMVNELIESGEHLGAKVTKAIDAALRARQVDNVQLNYEQ